MPLLLVRNDITKVKADAIVLPANPELVQGSGTSRAIFQAAGERELTIACKAKGRCKVGEAVITPAFNLDAKFILHAVCPVWQGGNHEEAKLLYSAYKRSMEIAKTYNARSIAFPLLSAGNYGYPKDKALDVANKAIGDFLDKKDMDVYLVFYDKEVLREGEKRFGDIDAFIDDNYVDRKDEDYYEEEYLAELAERSLDGYKRDQYGRWRRQHGRHRTPTPATNISYKETSDIQASYIPDEPVAMERAFYPEALELEEAEIGEFKGKSDIAGFGRLKKAKSLDDIIGFRGETFHEMLLRLCVQSEMKPAEIYKRANMSKQQFSKIRRNADKTPTKKTIISLAIGLKLELEETQELLVKAGYSLSQSSKFDLIVAYYILHGVYNYMEINEALFDHGLENQLIGYN